MAGRYPITWAIETHPGYSARDAFSASRVSGAVEQVEAAMTHTIRTKHPWILPGFLTIFVIFSIIPHQAAAVEPVEEPVLLRQIKWLNTSWFGSPIVHTLGGNNRILVGTFYTIYAWDKDLNEITRAPYGDEAQKGRIYPPAVTADLEGDGIWEIVAASTEGSVAAYEWINNDLVMKTGWPVTTCDGGQCPENRGIAAGDLDHDGIIEVVVTTTQTATDAQVFVFNPDGSHYQPAGYGCTAWPRYNQDTGECGDADDNGPGNDGFGCYGLNVGIGNLDEDGDLEIVVTYDNHQINVFNHTGTSTLASDYFTNRDPLYLGNRMNWGQFIRWFEPGVEEDHYHLHTGEWPHPDYNKWLQWTKSPPNVVDVNGDGKNEVVGIPNVEKDTTPYDTKHHSVMVLEGNYGDGSRSAMRLSGWEQLPSSGYPQVRTDNGWYPPPNPVAAVTANLSGDSRPETLYAAHDGFLYCYSPDAELLWRYDFRHGRDVIYASEPMVADLNRDYIPEVIFTTYGTPESREPGVAHGYLVILNVGGDMLHDLELPEQGTNGNGKGAPAAPTVMDLNGDGTLEIIVQTFGAGLFAYTVPGSAENMLVWPTGRGNYLRDGRSWRSATGEIFSYDMNDDGLVGLPDVVATLQVLAGKDVPVRGEAEPSGNGRVDMEDCIALLKLLENR